MAKRKSSRSKSTGLGLGLDALIKAKTKPVEEIEDDSLSDLEAESKNKELVDESNKDSVTEKTPKKRTRKAKNTKPKTTKASQKSVRVGEVSNKNSNSFSSSSIDTQRVDAVLIEVKKNPRISLWSARSAAVLRYLKKTQPEFSISNEASKLIEEAVKDKYPEIWDIFDDL